MKMGKSTIVWLVLSMLLAASQAVETDNSDDVAQADATYIKDAKALPGNKRKLMMVSGYPEMLEAAIDEDVGISFPSPKMYRSVEILTCSSTFKDWRVKTACERNSEGGFKAGTLTGRVATGAFELDQEIAKRIVGGRDADKEDFSSEDTVHMEETGSLIKSGGRLCCTDGRGENLFSSGETWTHPERYNDDFYRWNKKLGDSHKIWQAMWDIAPDDELTVVGIQKGNTLIYRDNVEGGISKDRIVGEHEMTDSTNRKHIKHIAYATVLLFTLLGFRSMFKKRKETWICFGTKEKIPCEMP